MSIERTMPSSTIERRSSGSMTPRSASFTWSCVGSAIAAHSRKGRASGRGAAGLRREGGEIGAPAPLGPDLRRGEDEAGGRDGAGTRGGVGRIAAMAIGLAVLLLLLLAGEARAGLYRVAQCGWGVGAELDPSDPRDRRRRVLARPRRLHRRRPGSGRRG